MLKQIKYMLLILAASMLILLIVFVSVNKNEERKIQLEKEHVIVSTIVIDKYYEEGYCSWYWCKGTTYVLVSVQEFSDGSKTTWTHNVNQRTYNSYSIGDELLVCEFHEKLEIDE